MERLAIVVAWAAVVGSGVQFLAQFPFVLKLVPALRIAFATGLESVRTVVRNFVPVFISRGVVQLSAFIDTWLASFLPYGALAGLLNAQMLYLLPVSLFGMSVSASELPEMSSATGRRREVAEFLVQRLTNGLRRIALLRHSVGGGFHRARRLIAGAIYQTRKIHCRRHALCLDHSGGLRRRAARLDPGAALFLGFLRAERYAHAAAIRDHPCNPDNDPRLSLRTPAPASPRD